MTQSQSEAELWQSNAKTKLILLGDAECGKSSIVRQFSNDTFKPEYESTVGICSTSKTMYLEAFRLPLEICDACADESAHALRSATIRDSPVAIVVYDVTDRASFSSVHRWVNDVRRERGTDATIILVGNKVDKSELREVSSDEGKARASELRVLFTETSARTGLHVTQLFVKIAEALFWRTSFLRLRAELEADDKKKALLDGLPLETMTANALLVLNIILEKAAHLDRHSAAEIALNVWKILVIFVNSFPPKQFSPEQVEIIVLVACRCLGMLRSELQQRISVTIWEHEKSALKRWRGVNSLLRLAAGVFPNTFKPLLQLLCTLANDEKSADHVCWTLEHGLESITEQADSYSQHLISVDDDAQAVHLLQNLKDSSIEYLKVLTMTSPSEFPATFVQARVAIPGSPYRKSLPAASFGMGCQSSGVVTWAVHWDGWGAIFHVLRVFLRIIRQHGVQENFEEAVMEDIVSSVVTVFALIEKICSCGSEWLCHKIAVDLKMMSTLTDLLMEIADPGELAQGSWLNNLIRQELLMQVSSCLASMSIGSVARAQYVLENLALSKSGDQPLHSALISLGAPCFSAIAAVAGIAGSHLLETYLPNGVDLASIVSRMHVPNVKGAGIRRHGVAAIMKLLVDSVLPVWNASDPSDNDPGGSLYESWEFPADVLEFLIGATDLSRNSFSVAETISRVTVKSTSRISEHETLRSHFNILRALRASLVLSLDGLTKLRTDPPAHKKGSSKLTNLEKALISSDTVNALALICSGCAPLLDENVISAAQGKGRLQGYAYEFEKRYAKDSFQRMSASDVKSSIEDLAADCLSRLFYRLQSYAGAEDIVQVPWPVTGISPLVIRHGGGEKIREGIAKRLDENGSASSIDLLVSVLCCGQRAAARSLLGPLPKQERPNSDAANNDENVAPVNIILTSVAKLIRKGLKTWVASSTPDSNSIEPNKYVLLVSKCVHFLIVAWSSQNTGWFQDFWRREKMWTLLASLLRCDGTKKQPDLFDVADAVLSPYKDFVTDPMFDENECSPREFEERIQRACSSIDAACTWRRTVSDLFTMFASELLVCTGKASRKYSGTSSEEGTKSKAKKIGDEIFSQAQFQAFGEVFTEKWMHVLLQPNDWLLFKKSTSEDVTDNNAVVFEGLSWKNSDTIDALTTKLSIDLGATVGLSNMESPKSLISVFQKQGDEGTFGPDYRYDIRLVWMLLKRAGMTNQHAQKVIIQLMYINSLWSRADVQLFLTRSFAAMTYSVVFADVLAPVPGKALTYASPQFSGKLSRCLARYIVTIRSTGHLSAWTLEVQNEMAKLLSFLSARLSNEELEQPVLTMMRFSSELDDVNHGLKMTPLGQLSFAIDRLIPLAREELVSIETKCMATDVLESLLIAASYLKTGVAFRNEDDLLALGQTCFFAIRSLPGDSKIAQAASTAIMSLQTDSSPQMALRLMRFNPAESVFNSIASLEKPPGDQYSIEPATSCLLLMLAQYLSWLPNDSDAKSQSAQLILHHLSGGSVSALFPRGSSTIRTYHPQTLTREPMHIAWCSSLTLASLSICNVEDPTDITDQHILDILEFASSNLEQISRESLNIHGDWPPYDLDRADGSVPRVHTTIARVEEAEIAAEILFQLSVFAIRLIDTLPGLTRLAIIELLRFVHHAHKLLRSEPLERWIKPVSEQEKARSEYSKSGKDTSSVVESLFVAGSPWAGSPPTPTQGSPPLRSPRQAILAAINGSGGKTPISGIGGAFAPPSPGMPLTPQLSSPGYMTARSTAVPMSPGASPWTPHGSGLISNEGLYFGEECARSLLRALNFAAGALRRFCSAFNEPFVEASMQRSEGPLDFGSLIALQYHCVNEIQHGVDGERRQLYMMIVENLMHICITHLRIFEERGALDTGFRNEVANKMNTVVSRLKKTVPPPLSFSLALSSEIDVFIRSLQHHM